MTKTVDAKTVVSGARNNKQIWRVAEWICDCGTQVFEIDVDWADIPEDDYIRELCYDKAAELMKKIQLNEFTGEDTHGD